MPSRRRLALLILLTLLYLAFLLWFDGLGQPLSPTEAQTYLARIQSSPQAAAHPELVPNLRTLTANDDGKPFYMLNLESVRPGPRAKHEDSAYASAILPALLRRACFPTYVGTVQNTLLGRSNPGLSRVIIVRYRSLRDFLQIFTTPGIETSLNHKFAALSETRVTATSPVFALIPIRTLVGLLILLVITRLWRRPTSPPTMSVQRPTAPPPTP